MDIKVRTILEDFKTGDCVTKSQAEKELLSIITQVVFNLDALCLNNGLFDNIKLDKSHSRFVKINYVTPSKVNVYYKNTFNGDEYDIDFLVRWFDIDYEKFWKEQKEKVLNKLNQDLEGLNKHLIFLKEEIEQVKNSKMPDLSKRVTY